MGLPAGPLPRKYHASVYQVYQERALTQAGVRAKPFDASMVVPSRKFTIKSFARRHVGTVLVQDRSVRTINCPISINVRTSSALSMVVDTSEILRGALLVKQAWMPLRPGRLDVQYQAARVVPRLLIQKLLHWLEEFRAQSSRFEKASSIRVCPHRRRRRAQPEPVRWRHSNVL